MKTSENLDKSNIEYQTNYILSCYKAGELFRAWVEIEDLFSNADPNSRIVRDKIGGNRHGIGQVQRRKGML